MPDYSLGKIYTIRCKNDQTLVYVGSTVEKLCNRFSKHKFQSMVNPNTKFYTTVKDWNDWYIELYEDCPCERKEQLLKREGEIAREIGNLNMQTVGIYSNMHKKEYMQKYREKHADEIKEYKKYNYESKKNEILQNQKEKYEKNKEMFLCSCGCSVSKHNLTRHEKSVKHLKLLNNQNSVEVSPETFIN